MDASSQADRARRNRRRGAVAFGLIALPVVGTAFVLPAIANATPASTAAAVAPASSATTTDPDQAAVQAYLDAGYSFDDAVTLASLWNANEDAYQAKVQAGGFLADGVALLRRLIAEHDIDTVWFGASAPLGLLGGHLRRRAGVRRVLASERADVAASSGSSAINRNSPAPTTVPASCFACALALASSGCGLPSALIAPPSVEATKLMREVERSTSSARYSSRAMSEPSSR